MDSNQSAETDELFFWSAPLVADVGVMLPLSFLVAVGVVFACVSTVLSADRAKARTARRLSIASILVLAVTATGALIGPKPAGLGRGATIGLLGFAATVGLSTWLNVRSGWSFRNLLMRVFLPGLLLSIACASF